MFYRTREGQADRQQAQIRDLGLASESEAPLSCLPLPLGDTETVWTKLSPIREPEA